MNKKFKLFEFTSIFESKRGTRFTKDEQISGDIPYISSTKLNNGIDNYVTPPEYSKKGAKIVIYKNCMTLSNSGSVGYLFYHDYEFVASDHVTVIWLKDTEQKLTKNIALYLKPIFESIKYKYKFGREISDPRLKKEKIILPVNSNNQPDWEYMENYIENLKHKIIFKKLNSNSKYTNNCQLDFSSWHEYKISKLFNDYTGTDLILRDNDSLGNEYNITSHKKYNNSVGGVTSKIEGRKLFDSNKSIAIADRGYFKATVQTKDFYIGTRVKALEAKFEKCNKYILFFISTIINQESFRFSYGRNCCDDLPMLKIKLPSILNEKNEYIPDFDYMEKFIQSLPYSVNI